jgi:SnoaL-like domain
MKYPNLKPDQIITLGVSSDDAIRTKSVIQKFHEAFDSHDPEAMDGLVADDCVIENTNPAPNGANLIGKAACLANWQNLAISNGTWFEREEVFVIGDRAVIRWRYCWGDNESQSIRGLNLMRVKDGLIIEAMGYVKG